MQGSGEAALDRKAGGQRSTGTPAPCTPSRGWPGGTGFPKGSQTAQPRAASALLPSRARPGDSSNPGRPRPPETDPGHAAREGREPSRWLNAGPSRLVPTQVPAEAGAEGHLSTPEEEEQLFLATSTGAPRCPDGGGPDGAQLAPALWPEALLPPSDMLPRTELLPLPVPRSQGGGEGLPLEAGLGTHLGAPQVLRPPAFRPSLPSSIWKGSLSK